MTDEVTVKLTAWECERLVLALAQAVSSVPLQNSLASMHHLAEIEKELVVKLDMAFNSLVPTYTPYKRVI